MKTILRSENLEEIIKVTEVTDSFSTTSTMQEFDSIGVYRGITGTTKGLLINDIGIFDSSMHLPQDLTMHVESDSPYLEMHFELDGGSSYKCESGKSMDINYSSGCHTLYYLPELKGFVRTQKHPHRRYFEIQLSIEFLTRIFGNDLSFLKQFGENIENNKPVMLGGKTMTITSDMHRIILDIRSCPYAGILKKVYVEAKVIELLSLQIAQANTEVSLKKSHLPKADIEKLYHAKELVMANITEPYSLTQLARITGLNSFKLKEGFKELFDNTVFGYLADIRMQQAHALLKRNEHSISEIAHLIGYKNPHHFSAAFKKKYGIVPSKLKS